MPPKPRRTAPKRRKTAGRGNCASPALQAALTAVDPATVKLCVRCGETKPRDEFSAAKRHRDGLSAWCKACHRGASAADYREHVPNQWMSLRARGPSSVRERR
jgi:hypothetical protein